MKNGKPDFSLDQDNIHLNQQDGTIFGTFIRQHIDSIIGIQRGSNQVSGERDIIVIDTDDEPTGSKSYRRQHFQHGRFTWGSQRAGGSQIFQQPNNNHIRTT